MTKLYLVGSNGVWSTTGAPAEFFDRPGVRVALSDVSGVLTLTVRGLVAGHLFPSHRQQLEEIRRRGLHSNSAISIEDTFRMVLTPAPTDVVKVKDIRRQACHYTPRLELLTYTIVAGAEEVTLKDIPFPAGTTDEEIQVASQPDRYSFLSQQQGVA